MYTHTSFGLDWSIKIPFTLEPGLDLNEYLITKEANLKKMGINLQPHVVVICEDVNDISEGVVLAVIQSNLYFQVPSIVTGIDVCFKACFVFHLNFGNGAKSSWLFVQKAVFAIDTEHDGENTKVLQLMAEISKN